MSSGGSFFESRKFKNIMKFVYGWGGAIVIIGALFKILHLPGAGFWLTFGLLTEAAIFFISAFEPLHEDPDWSLVYPELAMGHADHDLDELPDALSSDALDVSVDDTSSNSFIDSLIRPR